MTLFNPFIVEGYKSPEYFCDRALDTQLLKEHLQNQRNVALISPRRLGKSGLIHNLFYQQEIKKSYSSRLSISQEAFDHLYTWAGGVTWYIQSVLNALYASKQVDVEFSKSDVDAAIEAIVHRHTFAYKALLYQLSAKQKQVLQMIAKEGKAQQIMSQQFLGKYSVTASTIQAAVKVLLDRDFITLDENIYQVSDKFFELYLRKE